MDNIIQTVETPFCLLVKMGLGSQRNRACAGAALATLVAYALKKPQGAFREDGTMKPFAPLSPEHDAVNAHFLLVPVTAALACYYCT